MKKFDMQGYGELLKNWIVFSQKHLYYCPDRPELICYGAGDYGAWAVQTNQKAFAAFAVAATLEEIDWSDCCITREQVREQALGILRFILSSHVSGDYYCTDGKKWGNGTSQFSWLLCLGIERMYHGIEALDAYLTDADREGVRSMILSECDFLLNEYEIEADLLYSTGKNKPESNIWNGAILYRAAALYPDLPDRDRYIEKARKYFANGISIQSDENSDEIVDGQRIGDLFVGANMFDSYANNHHGYMNVGYMVICLSNIAMLHFFLKGKNMKPDDMIYHHVYDQWKLISTSTMEDGRLFRTGGDSRVRYCYCQDYALPMWALIEDVYGEDCSEMEAGWLQMLKQETAVNGDGSFLSNRMGHFEEDCPVYYTRLEADRANAISMVLYWHKKFDLSGEKKVPKLERWSDEYHGAAMTVSDKRYTSFVWGAFYNPQGLLVPADESSLAEWRYNLSGHIEGVGRNNTDAMEAHSVETFDGGFITCGSTISMSSNFLAEGQLPERIARKYVAFAALPDDSTVLCLQHAKTLNRAFVAKIQGVFWNIPNDIYNKRQRTIYYEDRAECLRGGDYATRFETISLGDCMNVDNKMGIAANKPLTLVRAGKRQIATGRAGSPSLYVEEVYAPYSTKHQWYDKGSDLIDVGFAVSLGDWESTKEMEKNLISPELEGLKAVGTRGKDGKLYVLVANLDEQEQYFDPDALGLGEAVDVAKKEKAAGRVLKEREALLLCFA